jgi:hypothetical protein
VSLHELFHKYHGRVQFALIYIREAHPADGWGLGGGIPGLVLKAVGSKAATDVHDPRTIEERRAVAMDCEAALQYGIRTYVDGIDDRVNKAYAAMPTRMYLIGENGRVAYAGGIGPYGFSPAKLRAAIEAHLAGGNAAG